MVLRIPISMIEAVEEEKPNVEEIELEIDRLEKATDDILSRSKRISKVHRSEKPEKPYSCAHCENSFGHSGNLQTHLNVHTKEKPNNCLKLYEVV